MSNPNEQLHQDQGNDIGFDGNRQSLEFEKWIAGEGLKKNIPLTLIKVNYSPGSLNRLSSRRDLLAPFTVFAGVVGSALNDAPTRIPKNSDSSTPRKVTSRRSFLKASGLTAVAAGLVSCMPSSSPQPVNKEVQPKLVPPTPQVVPEKDLLASLTSDSTFVDAQTWGRNNFIPQMEALAIQFPPDTVQNMKMNIFQAQGEDNKPVGYIFEVVDEKNKKHVYSGADTDGSGGVYITISDELIIEKDRKTGLNRIIPINQKQDRYVYRYSTPDRGDYLDPRIGMMVGIGIGVTDSTQLNKGNEFLTKISPLLSNFVKDQVLNQKQDQAEFSFKVNQSNGKFYGTFEEINNEKETSIYVVSESAEIHKLDQVSGYTYSLDEITGEILLYKDGEKAGRVKTVNSKGQVLQIETTPDATATAEPTNEPKPTGTPTSVDTPIVVVTQGATAAAQLTSIPTSADTATANAVATQAATSTPQPTNSVAKVEITITANGPIATLRPPTETPDPKKEILTPDSPLKELLHKIGIPQVGVASNFYGDTDAIHILKMNTIAQEEDFFYPFGVFYLENTQKNSPWIAQEDQSIADYAVSQAQAKGLKLFLEPVTWNEAAMKKFETGAAWLNDSMSAEDTIKSVEERGAYLAKRYADKGLDTISVAVEPYESRDGVNWKIDNRWDKAYKKVEKPYDYIEGIARAIREVNTNVHILGINPYGALAGETVADLVYEKYKQYKEHRAPIDTVGFQGDIKAKDLPLNISAIRKNIQRFQDLGFRVDVNSIRITGTNDAKVLAKAYYDLSVLCGEMGCPFSVWGIVPKDVNNFGGYPIFYDENVEQTDLLIEFKKLLAGKINGTA